MEQSDKFVANKKSDLRKNVLLLVLNLMFSGPVDVNTEAKLHSLLCRPLVGSSDRVFQQTS